MDMPFASQHEPRLFADATRSRDRQSGRFRYVSPTNTAPHQGRHLERITAPSAECDPLPNIQLKGHPSFEHCPYLEDNGQGKIVRGHSVESQQSQQLLQMRYDVVTNLVGEIVNNIDLTKESSVSVDECKHKFAAQSKHRHHQQQPPETIDVIDHHEPLDDEDFVFGSYSQPESNVVTPREDSFKSFVPHAVQIRDWPWSRMVNESKWHMLHDALISVKQQRAVVSDDMIIDTDSDSTILHTVAWKAPSKLTLLLLEVLTKSAAARTKKYLLCGDAGGNTPLHLACANLEAAPLAEAAVDFSVIKNLLLLAPDALSMVNDAGDTPLHLLLASDAFGRKNTSDAAQAAAEEAIASLLLMAGHLAVTQNNNGCTLLHVAIACHCNERVLIQLLILFPDAAIVMDRQGMLPLHYVAAFGGTSCTIAQVLVEACPDTICCQTINGDTPLHLLVANATRNAHQMNQFYVLDRQTTKLAELLMGTGEEEMTPLLIQNHDDLTPLHCCAVHGTPVQITSILMNRGNNGYARIASVLVSQAGSTALHLAVLAASKGATDGSDKQHDHARQKNAEATVVSLATNQACSIFDSNGRTPLMLAVEAKTPSSAVVKLLTKMLPKSSATRTSDESLAIHLACKNRRISASTVRALLRAYPDGASCLTTRRNTPLHEAAKHGVNAEVIELLIDKYPNALLQRNTKKERPIDRAHPNTNKKVVALLDEATHNAQLSLSPTRTVPDHGSFLSFRSSSSAHSAKSSNNSPRR